MNPPAAATAPTTSGPEYPSAAPGYAPYPRLSPEDVTPPPPYHAATATPSAYGGNPYVASPAGASASAPKSASPRDPNLASLAADSVEISHVPYGFFFVWCLLFAGTMDSVKDVLGKMGKRVGEAARKTETLTGNFWQHCWVSISELFFWINSVLKSFCVFCLILGLWFASKFILLCRGFQFNLPFHCHGAVATMKLCETLCWSGHTTEWGAAIHSNFTWFH
jgi:hypothetical protein